MDLRNRLPVHRDVIHTFAQALACSSGGPAKWAKVHAHLILCSDIFSPNSLVICWLSALSTTILTALYA